MHRTRDDNSCFRGLRNQGTRPLSGSAGLRIDAATDQALQGDGARVVLGRGLERGLFPSALPSPVRGSRGMLASQPKRGVRRTVRDRVRERWEQQTRG